MMPFRDYEHLLRMAALFAVGVGAFAMARAVLVPEDYGLLGPYRASAIALNQARPIVYAGQAQCITCHTDVAERRAATAHAPVSCESCHGALAVHAADPAMPPPSLDPRVMCAVCHQPNAAKPPSFKTVVFADHAGEEACTSCHEPHAPGFP